MKQPTEKQTSARVMAAASAAGKRKLAGSARNAKPAGGRAHIVAVPLGSAEDRSSSAAAGVWLRTVPRAAGSV